MNRDIRFLVPAVLLVFVAALAYGQGTNLVPNGGFESGKPSLWNAEPGTSGATLTWATDQVYNGTHSLKIAKATTGGMARWISGNNVRYWVDNIPDGVDIKLGAWVKTSGVNTSPANDAARWQLKFWFYDTLGALIGGVPFVLNVDQSAATRDWYADTNGVGTVNLPVKAYQMKISLEGGTDATGTVWMDNVIFVGRANAWAGQNWNGFADADSGWQYWIAPTGGNDGETYFPGSGVTTEQAHSGSYSLKVAAPVGRQTGELVWFTETMPIPANSAGKKYVLSSWVKTSGIKKDSVFNASYALGFTWTWHRKMFVDAGGWDEFGSGEYRFVLKDTSTNWTQYQVIIEVPDNSVRAVSIRPRAFNLWTGVAWYDDMAINPIDAVGTGVDDPGPIPGSGEIPNAFRLEQNYPNPFNPSTTIVFDLPVRSPLRLEVYNIIGQKVRTLVDGIQPAGRWTMVWNGRDDAGAPAASGIYFCRMVTPDHALTTKMLLLK
ncbi:MAG: FlgD immunoglobulin-like domain containing protein [Bacteroidota bacterium]